MEICYGSKGVNNYVEIFAGDVNEMMAEGNYYKIRMLEDNRISCVLPTSSTEVDGNVYLRSDVTSYYVLGKLFLKLKPDGELLKIIFLKLIKCMEELSDFLLVPEDLYISPDYMFYEPESKILKLIYIPGYGVNVRTQLREFTEYVMKMFDHRDRQGTILLYDIYNVIVREDLDLKGIKKFLENNNTEEKPVNCGTLYAEKDNKDNEEENEENSSLGKNKLKGIFFILVAAIGIYFVFRFIWSGKKGYAICAGIITLIAAVVYAAVFLFREEENIDEIMEDYKLSNELKPDCVTIVKETDNRNSEKIKKLVPLTNGALRDICINEKAETIVVGRDKKDTDYRVPATQISRIHACIYSVDGEVFVEDRASTNGTFVNNNRIDALTQYKLKKGDVVSFANEEFFAS